MHWPPSLISRPIYFENCEAKLWVSASLGANRFQWILDQMSKRLVKFLLDNLFRLQENKFPSEFLNNDFDYLNNPSEPCQNSASDATMFDFKLQMDFFVCFIGIQSILSL